MISLTSNSNWRTSAIELSKCVLCIFKMFNMVLIMRLHSIKSIRF
jgi:hypothetical protein